MFTAIFPCPNPNPTDEAADTQATETGKEFTLPATVRVAQEAMRTRFEIVLHDPNRPEADLRAAGEAALAEIAEVERWLSVYRPEAALYLLNARAADEPVPVDGRVWAFLQRAQEYTEQTGGTFDLTVGPLLQLWNRGATDALPDDAERTEALSRVGMEKMVMADPETRTVRFTRSGVRLDPGALGKGYALDRAGELLREYGIRRALLHGGTSSVVAIGSGWRIALQHPRLPGETLGECVLADAALSVSAVHGKTFYAGGRSFGHVIDPRTGFPVENNLLTAVVAPTASDAEALSTGLLVGGAEFLPQWAARFPDAGFLLVENEPTGKGDVRVRTAGKNPGWKQHGES
ncbi:MAG: FAD:protein FMN transferase [Armatimonadaceae bacterium]